MKNTIFILLLCSTASLTTHGQHNVRLTGFVKSTADKNPLALITVKIASQEVYTATNNEGYFDFTFPYGNDFDSLQFWGVGYEPKSVAVSGFRFQQEVLLDPSKLLDESISRLGKRLGPAQIIAQAALRLRENYADTFSVEGYFRKYQKIDSVCIFYLDAAVEISDDQFTSQDSKKAKPLVRILAQRKSKLYNEKGYSTWADSSASDPHWLARLFRQNDVRTRSGLLGAGNVYDTAVLALFDGRLCYEVSVLKKPLPFLKSATHDTKLVIDAHDFSIYRITDEEHAGKGTDKKHDNHTRRINGTLSTRVVAYTKILEFRRTRGKLLPHYLSEAIQTEDYKTLGGDVVHTNTVVSELMVNKILSKVSPLLRQLKPRERAVLQFANGPYDRRFWESFNLISLTKENLKAWEDLSKRMPVEEQFRSAE